MSKLKDKKVVVCNELTYLLETTGDLFLKYGCDPIPFELKHMNFYSEFRGVGFLLVNSNHSLAGVLQNSVGYRGNPFMSQGLKGRFVPITFDNVITECIKDYELKFMKKHEAELASWIVHTPLDLFRCLVRNKTIEHEAENLLNFVRDEIVIAPGHQLANVLLKDRHHFWCDKNGCERDVKDQNIRQAVLERVRKIHSRAQIVNTVPKIGMQGGGSQRGCAGIRLKKENDDDDLCPILNANQTALEFPQVLQQDPSKLMPLNTLSEEDILH